MWGIGGMKEAVDKVIEITDMNFDTFNGIPSPY